jgi:hypothetical protein
MSSVGGPKGPGRSPALQRFLETERAKKQDQTKAPATQAKAPADRFATEGSSVPTPVVPGGLAGQAPGAGALSVRLGAMTGQEVSSELPPAPGGFRVVERDGVKIAEGDVSIEKAADLERLTGVQRIAGSLDISECVFDDDALEALTSLRQVDGGLALEGNAALAALDPLAALQGVGGNLYLGFNDELSRVSLPRLEAVGGALIVEGNGALEALELGGLKSVAGYVHLHENEALTRVALGALADVGGELSILENPELVTVEMTSLSHLGGEIEIVDNGADKLGGIPRVS